MENTLQKEALHIVNFLEKSQLILDLKRGDRLRKAKKIQSIYQIRGSRRFYLTISHNQNSKNRLQKEKISQFPKSDNLNSNLKLLRSHYRNRSSFSRKSSSLRKTVFYKTAKIASARKQVKSIKTLLENHSYNFIKIKAHPLSSKSTQNEEIKPNRFNIDFNINRITDFNQTD